MLSKLHISAFLLIISAFPAIADPVHSAAKPDDVAIKHLHLNLKADFSTKQLDGSATLTLDRKSDSTKLRLDTLGLTIKSVEDTNGKLLDYSLEPSKSYLGRPLEIELGEKSAGVSKVVIEYSTRPGAEALQWLSPEQTTGGKHPFLFTQSQAILARTWLPCQDTPAVRMTYSAHVEVPKDLMAVMSASNPVKKSPDGHYDFEMKQPIPSYLLALAIGDLEFKSIGPRSGVYAEPNVVRKAAWELADTEAMIKAAEKLYGPYRWDRYDVIFLPPSFPFGGMENPRLTFATPTILAGDRSLVALIAHELAHSWSGNLVTNATWDDFWLNEGFTVYFEQRIMEAVYGRKYSEMLAKLALDSLKEELQSLSRRDTWLKLDLRGRNPDDGMTGVAYDKGYLFLRMLEETVGREKWDGFLKEYFTQYSFQSMTTESFVERLESKLLKPLNSSVNVQQWVYGPGLPENCPDIQTTELEQVANAAKSFASGTSATKLDTKDWTTHHWLHFLRSLPDNVTLDQMQRLDAAFQFTSTGNSEILHDWLLRVIQTKYEPGYGALESFLTRQGRRKFLEPLYRKLATTDAGTNRAKSIYEKARPGYHAVSRETIDQILGIQNSSN